MTSETGIEKWERFAVARVRAGMTLAEIGVICGCTAQAVKKWEDGVCMPSSKRLMMVCEALDCSLEWIMSNEPLDFHSTRHAPQGRHAKYWVREAMDEYFRWKADMGHGNGHQRAKNGGASV